jgi:molecular chaperone GrpE
MTEPTTNDEPTPQAEAPDADPPRAEADAETGSGPDALASLRGERDSLQDRLLRTAAEFDNYRKRIQREQREEYDRIKAALLSELLPIVDNLERALQAPVAGDEESYRRGVELIHKQMLDLLRKRGVTSIEAVGADFDPNLHEAVMHEPSDAHREGEVMAELQRGYKIGDRLLRPAMVKVAKTA